MRWQPPAEALKVGTGNNGELLQMTALRSPCPGRIGVIEPGAAADLLLVDGDPIANIGPIEDPAKNLLVTMKDGHLFKQTLPRRARRRSGARRRPGWAPDRAS